MSSILRVYQILNFLMTMSISYLDLSQDRKEIRLLQLLPSPGPQYERIPCCRLLQIGLEEAPPYNALSYAWEDTKTNRVIMVDGMSIRIPQNLFNAMITLRPAKSPVLMWVDYLCINQQNDTEKAWQVALMRNIYSRADEVIAWLGLGDDQSRRAIEYLDAIGEEAYLCGFYHDQHIGDPLWQILATFYSTHAGDLSFDCFLEQLKEILYAGSAQQIYGPALTTMLRLGNLFHKINGWNSNGKCFPIREMKNLLRRSWFQRVWVLQEIALSKRGTYICGTTKIDRVRLCAAMNAYQCFRGCLGELLCGRDSADALGLLTSYHHKAFLELFFRATMMANAPRIMLMSHFPLIALLRLTCVGSPNHQKHGPHHLDSSDPRDKIFALLGLASDREDLGKKGVIPDYTKSWREVYTFTTSVLLQQGHLSVLSYVQPHRGPAHGNLPSWVPNWYQAITTPLQAVHDDHMTLWPEFSASGTGNPTPTIKIARNASGIYGISLEGIVCDKVHSVGVFPRRVSSWNVPLEETFSWPEEWIAEILRLTYQIKGGFPSFEERLHAVARTSVGGARSDLQGNFGRTSGDIYLEAGHLLQKSLRRVKDRHIKIEGRKFLARTGIGNRFNAADMALMRLPNDIIGRSLKRLPFITASGRLGLGYDNIQAGDIVTIIRGAQVPYILRAQQTGTYNLISEAYVDGIMDGEALRGAAFTWLNLV